MRVPGSGDTLNQSLEKAGRVADFMEFAEVMCRDALDRDESCGAHFREEHQTEEGEGGVEAEQGVHAGLLGERDVKRGERQQDRGQDGERHARSSSAPDPAHREWSRRRGPRRIIRMLDERTEQGIAQLGRAARAVLGLELHGFPDGVS